MGTDYISTLGLYCLGPDGEPVLMDDTQAWADRHYSENRRVAETRAGQWYVSTVFMGIDYGFGSSVPILWETMIFGPAPWDDWTRRYSSRADAEAGHAEAVAMIYVHKRIPRRKVVPAE